MKMIFRIGMPLSAAYCLVLLTLILNRHGVTDLIYTSPALHQFKILFVSIILEAVPFVLLGALFSAVLQVFVSDAAVARLVPRNPIVGVLYGCLLGLVFPLCECGMIPVVRRLIRKGLPAYIGIVYIFAGPVINPVVFTSTYIAFRSDPAIAYFRMGLAFVVCAALGLMLHRFMKTDPMKTAAGAVPPTAKSSAIDDHACDCGHHHHGHSHHHHRHPGGPGWRERARSTFIHAFEEFLDMGKYLAAGSFITAVMQTALDRSVLTSIGVHPVLSGVFMMAFAFALSLCSTSDAFVAYSFTGIFGPGALLAFLVFGPMVDFKSTLMLLSTFRARFVLAVSAFLFIAVLAGSIAVQRLGWLH